MNTKTEFAVVFSLVILPFLFVFMLQDMTRRIFFSTVILLGLTIIFYVTISTLEGQQIITYIGSGPTPYILCALLGLLSGIILISFSFFKRQRYHQMDWPVTISQVGMERHGTSYLRRNGWNVSDESTFSGCHIFRCRKDHYRLIIVFLKDRLNFDLFCSELRSRRFDLWTVVALCHQDPTDEYKALARKAGPVLASYKSLLRIDQIAIEIRDYNHRANQMKIAQQTSVVSKEEL